MKGQKRGTCRTCQGRAHFYPRLELGEPVLGDQGEVLGAWTHLDEADWRANPHPVDPEEA